MISLKIIKVIYQNNIYYNNHNIFLLDNVIILFDNQMNIVEELIGDYGLLHEKDNCLHATDHDKKNSNEKIIYDKNGLKITVIFYIPNFKLINYN